MRSYLYIAAVLLFLTVCTAYFNLFQGISSFVYTLRYLPLPIMLAAPLVTSSVFAGNRSCDRMLISLGLSEKSMIFGRLFAVWLVCILPVLPALALPPVLGALGGTDTLASYAGIASLFVFCAAYSSALLVISLLCKTHKQALGISYGFFAAAYVADMVYSLIPLNSISVIAVAVVLAAGFSAAIYGFTKSSTAAITVFSAVTVIFCALSTFLTKAAYFTVRYVLSFLSPNVPVNDLLGGGIFEITKLLLPVVFTVYCILLCIICSEKRRTE